MAIDTSTERAGFIPWMLPFPSGTLGTREKRVLMGLFAVPVPVWVELLDVSTTWTIQADAPTSVS